MFGITEGKTIDDFLDGLSLETTKIQSALSSIDDKVKESLATIDECSKDMIQNPENSILQMKTMELSLKQVEDLITLSKDIFKHIYESIMSSDLIDSELVHSLSTLLEGIHLNIQEFINLYRDKVNFLNKIKVMALQQEQKKELMYLKQKLDLEKIDRAKKESNSDTIDADGTMVFDIDKIVKALNTNGI